MLNRKTYFIKERVKFLRMSDTYDILDPVTQETIGIAIENPGTLIRVLRFLVNKRILPTRVDIYENQDNPPLLSIKRGVTFFRAKVDILNASGDSIGYFKSKMFTLGGGFHVYDLNDNKVAEVKGDWKGWNFKLLNASGSEVGTVTKTWAGIGQELFTSADNYVIDLKDPAEGSGGLLLAAGLAIDTVFNEN